MTVDAVVLDTAQFTIEPPPQGGGCRARPVRGVAISTRFELSSYGWEDSVLPLQYRFSWQQASAAGVFTSLNAWLELDSFQNVTFGSSGTIRCEPRFGTRWAPSPARRRRFRLARRSSRLKIAICLSR